MDVLWLTNIPSPYRVNFFNKLGEKCNLTVLFERNSASDRDESWKNYEVKNFKDVILKGIKNSNDTAISVGIFLYLIKKYDQIVISNPLTITGMMAIFYLKLIKRDYIIVGDGGQVKNNNYLKEKIKELVLSGAKLYLSTGNEHTNYYLNYGAIRERIRWYPFTSIMDADVLEKPPTKDEKDYIKRELGISHEKVVLVIGQFIHRKGFDIMLKASSNLEGNVGVYFVGGDPSIEYLKLKEELGLNNVYFIGFKTKEELSKYYKASDIFVLPTREDIWGLVINEAMAYGLPIITTNKCVAGLELITDYDNGFIVPVEKPSILSEKVLFLLNDDFLREQISINNLRKIAAYTIEKMVEEHISVFNEVKK